MKNKINLSIIITVIIFMVLVVITRLFSISDLPLQTVGVLFGGVLTALITYFLLVGQTQAEENKERNVRVFEEKSEKYNKFINKLWDIWDDREVSLEELNELIKLISKDIILYTKPQTVDKILTSLIEIADLSNSEPIKSVETTKKIQQHIFSIINGLAIEIGLGGKIEPQIQEKLNKLEDKVIPYLMQRDYKRKFLTLLNDKVTNSEILEDAEIYIKDKHLVYEILGSKVSIQVYGIEREKTEEKGTIFIYLNPSENKLNPYRHMTKSWGKKFLKNSGKWHIDLINLNDYESIKHLNIQNDFSNVDTIIQEMEERYQHQLNGKNISDIIDEVYAN